MSLPQLVLIRGLPGSGKSTIAHALSLVGYRHLEADQFFIEDGIYHFRPALLKEAHVWCLAKARQFIYSGQPVVVANTFTQKWEIEPYLKLVPYSTKIITAQGNYPNIHNVPADVIQRMTARWENLNELPA